MPGFATKLLNLCVVEVPDLSVPGLSNVCACNFSCKYREFAFTHPSDSFKKDFTDFLVRKISASDTVTIRIVRQGVTKATITDNTYGTFFASFTAQPLYVGFLADWTLIFDDFGGGVFTIEIDTVILGVSETFTSRDFFVTPFDEQLANRTVKIKTFQDGNILGNPFDFTDLLPGGWFSSIRIKGTLEKEHTFEEDKFFNTAFVQVQNREQTIREYTLKTELIPQTIASLINEEKILANTCFLTSYNTQADERFINLPVAPTGFSEINPLVAIGKLTYSLTFKDRTENLIKRNF